MNKTSIIPLVCLGFALSVGTAFAQYRERELDKPKSSAAVKEKIREREDTVVEKKEEIRTTQEQKREDVKNKIQESREKIKKHLAQVHGNRLQKRFSFYYQRFSKIIEKIETRMDALEEKGVDVSDATTALKDAKAILEDANDLSTKSVNQFLSVNVDDYTSLLDVIKNAKSNADASRARYKEVHSKLRDVVLLLVKARQAN